ncbi:MAG: ParB/RepB/Spo0J family partition protein [Minisyncoccia bacterium]
MNLIITMLGKGLESLIPQRGNSNSGQPSPDPGATPANTGGVSVPSPQIEEKPFMAEPLELPAEPVTELDLPAATPAELNLSHSDEQIAPFAIPATPAVVLPQVQKQLQQSPVNAVPKKKNELVPQEYVFHIEVDKITPNPSQPRRDFNEAAIRDLANSIREFGILQPIVVSKIGKETPDGMDVEYQLIAGERRLLASRLLGLRVIPAIIRNVDLEREKLEIAVIENLQRENLNPVEMARAFQRLQEEFRMTQREIAAKLGKSRETVANTVRLLDLPEYIQDALQKGNFSESHARLLLAVENPAAQRRLFDEIAEHGLTTRDVKERVKQLGGGMGHRGRPSLAEMEANLPPEMRVLQDELSSSLGAPVQIQKGASSGKITISFYSQEELENILRKLGKEEG